MNVIVQALAIVLKNWAKGKAIGAATKHVGFIGAALGAMFIALIGVAITPILMAGLLLSGVFSPFGALSPSQVSAATATVPLPEPGQLACPVSGAIVSQPFGPSSVLLEPIINGVHFHTGIDLAVPTGTPVRSAEDGQVEVSQTMVDNHGLIMGYGHYIKVDAAGNRQEFYGHLQSMLVTVGQSVRLGQVIGFSDTSGWSTGPHLHFEVRVNGNPIDPAPVMQKC